MQLVKGATGIQRRRDSPRWQPLFGASDSAQLIGDAACCGVFFGSGMRRFLGGIVIVMLAKPRQPAGAEMKVPPVKMRRLDD
ncbi:MAG: hypothetical protein K1X75_06010 [Leptospirales bacterium]|nr:hypothetical protein [Leptospirales bacterium]